MGVFFPVSPVLGGGYEEERDGEEKSIKGFWIQREWAIKVGIGVV